LRYAIRAENLAVKRLLEETCNIESTLQEKSKEVDLFSNCVENGHPSYMETLKELLHYVYVFIYIYIIISSLNKQ